MPYISAKDDRREALRNGKPALTAGELNYQIFYYMKHRMFESELITKRLLPTQRVDLIFNRIKIFVENFLGEKPNYQRWNDMTGCLLRCYRELRRRLDISDVDTIALIYVLDCYDDEIAKYEDTKIISNGDVE